MVVSKTQRIKIATQCACGCGKTFYPFPLYDSPAIKKNPTNYIEIKGERGGSLYIPKYIRGHHPNTSAHVPKGWNKGMKKGDHPSIERMGYQTGHEPYGNWDHVNDRFKSDIEFKKRWIESKKGQVAWNKGKTKAQYKNGIKSGPEHGNWAGGKNGIRDTSGYKDLCKQIMKRDRWKCQKCGDHNYKGRGSRIILDVHHIVAYSEDPKLTIDPKNLITLCRDCHIKTDNYGTKLIHKRRKQGGK